jgi:hypothetical protein
MAVDCLDGGWGFDDAFQGLFATLATRIHAT